MKRLKNQGFTIMESIIAILIVAGISVAAVSTILTVRSVSNGYYQRMVATTQLSNLTTCIESCAGNHADDFLSQLEFLYGAGTSAVATQTSDGCCVKQESGIDNVQVYRIYFDGTYHPIAVTLDDTGAPIFDDVQPVYGIEISVDSGESQTVFRYIKKDTTQSEMESPAGMALYKKLTETQATEYLVTQTITRDENGVEQASYGIDSSLSYSENDLQYCLDDTGAYVAYHLLSKASHEMTDYSNQSPEEIMAAIEGCFFKTGENANKLDSQVCRVVCTRNIAAYRVVISRIDGDEAKILAKTSTPIRHTLSKIDANGEAIADGEFGDAVGKALGFAGGDGSQERPFLISNAAQLSAMNHLSTEMRPVEQYQPNFLVFDQSNGNVYYYGEKLTCEGTTSENTETFYTICIKTENNNDSESSQPLLKCRYSADDDALKLIVTDATTEQELTEEQTTEPTKDLATLLEEAGVKLYVISNSYKEMITLPPSLVAEPVDSLAALGSRLLRRNYYYFRLTDNITLDGSDTTLCQNFCGDFDGDGYQIICTSGKYVLFGTMLADSTIHHVDVVENGGLLTLAENAGREPNSTKYFTISAPAESVHEEELSYIIGDRILFQKISIYGTLRTGDGEGPMVQNAVGRCTRFVSCYNYADMISYAKGGCAIYVTKTLGANARLEFDDCLNFATILGKNAALFVACQNSTPNSHISAQNSCSYGEIIGTESSGYVYGTSFSIAEPGGGSASLTKQAPKISPSYLQTDANRGITSSDSNGKYSLTFDFVQYNLEEQGDAIQQNAYELLLQSQVSSANLCVERVIPIGDSSTDNTQAETQGNTAFDQSFTVQTVGGENTNGDSETASYLRYTAAFRQVRFLSKASAASKRNLNDVPTIATGKDLVRGVSYTVVEVEDENTNETWYIFDIDGTLDVLASTTAVVLGTDTKGLGADAADQENNLSVISADGGNITDTGADGAPKTKISKVGNGYKVVGFHQVANQS